ncbi:MAG: ribosome maturation factor RimM [Eubacteriales bacterium]|nr:ribosome maturation factor RimM [Eubacteriales bacterium]
MAKKFLEAGKIVGTHGVKGDLKVQSWCDSPETLCDFDTLYLDEKSPVTVEKAQVHKNIVLMHIKGVDTMEAAEAMKNRVLLLNRDDVELPDDLVFIQDILGFKVYDTRLDRNIGRVRDVLTANPAHDMYEIAGEDGRLVYIPAAKPFLKEIDMEAGVIYIESIEGLLE